MKTMSEKHSSILIEFNRPCFKQSYFCFELQYKKVFPYITFNSYTEEDSFVDFSK